MKLSKLATVITSAALAVFLLAGSVAVPILWRGFYYGQIDALALPARTGYSHQVIEEAFDEVMDLLVLDAPFGTGRLPWSESGRAHFADCQRLFLLDFAAVIISAAALVVMVILIAAKRVRLYRFLGRGPCFWAFAGLGLLVVILAVWAAIDFTGLFTAFHTAFFPGKSNWIFDYRTDAIILILPLEFWMRAAALVAGLCFGVGWLLAAIEFFVLRRRPPRSVYEELKQGNI